MSALLDPARYQPRAVTVERPGKCRTCRGLGRIGVTYDAATGAWDYESECPDCDGNQTAQGVWHD